VRHDSLQGIPVYRTSREITMFREPFQEFLSQSNRPNPNLPPHFINTNFCIISKSVRSNTVSTLARIYPGRSVFQILEGARELSLLKIIQSTSSTHPASNPMKTRASSLEVIWALGLITHIHIVPSLKFGGAISPLIHSS
jgi:hypothetical protein